MVNLVSMQRTSGATQCAFNKIKRQTCNKDVSTRMSYTPELILEHKKYKMGV